MVELANTGPNVPLLMLRFDSNAFVDAALVTVVIYDFVVEPSCAVTTVVMVLAPTFNATGVDAALPFTVTVAFTSDVTGVMVNDEIALVTDAV